MAPECESRPNTSIATMASPWALRSAGSPWLRQPCGAGYVGRRAERAASGAGVGWRGLADRVSYRCGGNRRGGGAEHGQRPRGVWSACGERSRSGREAENDVTVVRSKGRVDCPCDPCARYSRDDRAAALVERRVGAHAREGRALAAMRSPVRELRRLRDEIGAAEKLAALPMRAGEHGAVLGEHVAEGVGNSYRSDGHVRGELEGGVAHSSQGGVLAAQHLPHRGAGACAHTSR